MDNAKYVILISRASTKEIF